MSRGEKIFYSVIILMVIMCNPPVMAFVNKWAIKKPITLGFPTFWVWLQFWYIIGVVAFLIAVIKIDHWKKDI